MPYTPNVVEKIAMAIRERGLEQGWLVGSKTANKLNIEAWAGAIAALEAVGSEHTQHVTTTALYLIAPRGYRETVRIAWEAQNKMKQEEPTT